MSISRKLTQHCRIFRIGNNLYWIIIEIITKLIINLYKRTDWKFFSPWKRKNGLFIYNIRNLFYQSESHNFFIGLTSDSIRPDSTHFLFEVYTCVTNKWIWILSQNGFNHIFGQITARTINQKWFLKWFGGWLLMNLWIDFIYFWWKEGKAFLIWSMCKIVVKTLQSLFVPIVVHFLLPNINPVHVPDKATLLQL